MSKEEQNKIFDIFNIPKKGENIVDDEDIDLEAGSSDLPFETKVENINKEISILGPVKDLKKNIKIDVPNNIKPLDVEIPKVEKVVEVKKVEPEPTPIPVISTPDPVKVQVEPTTPVMEEKAIEEKTTSKRKIKVPPPMVDAVPEVEKIKTFQLHSRSDEQATNWALTSHFEKFERFYEAKADFLSNYLLRNGEIPFDKYYSELQNASVDTEVPTFDIEELGKRITEVMQWRDRIKFIQLHVNSQYFPWNQSIELLKGLLVKIEYERGKKEGMFYDHLKDMMMYYSELKGLFESCEIVSKHFDAAYASLSRQIAIIQPQQEYDRNMSGSSNNVKSITQTQKRFDSIPAKQNTNEQPPNVWNKLAK